MKIGTFVGKESIPTTNENIEQIKERFENILKECFPESENIEINWLQTTMDPYTATVFTAQNVISGYRTLTQSDGAHLNPKDHINPSGKITLMLFHDKGYDEAVYGLPSTWTEQGHSEDWHPDYDIESYTMIVNCSGMHREYRCHTWKEIQIADHYQYGTEISDLDFESPIRTFANICHTAKIKKS